MAYGGDTPIYAMLTDAEFPPDPGDDLFSDIDDDDNDADYVPDSLGSDSESELSTSFIPVGLMKRRAVTPDSTSGTTDAVHDHPPTPSDVNTNVTTTVNNAIDGCYLQNAKVDVKKHFCVFCGKPQSKLRRHIESQHQDERGVIPFLNASPKSKKEELAKLRNAGNHVHNLNTMKQGVGTVVVMRRKRKETTVDSFVPCLKCMGWFAKKDLWRHQCVGKDDNIPHRQLVKKGKLLLPQTSDNDLYNEIMASLRNDRISATVKTDDTIKLLGMRETTKNVFDQDRHGHIRNKLRELGRLLVELRKTSNTEALGLSDFICPERFKDVVAAVKSVAAYSHKTNQYGIPTLALKLGHSLIRCCILLKAKAIEIGDTVLKEKTEAYYQLHTILWDQEVTCNASRTMHEMKKNTTKTIPLTDDVTKLSKYLADQTDMLCRKISDKVDVSKETWERLCEVTLARIILFNRRRQGEASKMKLQDYNKGMEVDTHNEDVLKELSPFEKQLCKIMSRVEITGKRGRIVPVILTSTMKQALDLIVQHRELVGVPAENPFVFARANNKSLGHIRGCDCIRDLVHEVDLQYPHKITSTGLRKHIATMSQLVNLQDNELDVVAQYLGHDIRTHREHYRLPTSTVQVAKVTKLLLAMEGGKNGPSSVDVHPDDTIDSDEDDVDGNVNDDADDLGFEDGKPDGDFSSSNVATRTKSSGGTSKRDAAEELTITCPNNFVKLHRACYNFVQEQKSWTDAEEACQGIGAQLTSITSKLETDALTKHLETMSSSLIIWWIGFEREEERGSNWIWLSDRSKVKGNIKWKHRKLMSIPGKRCGEVIVSKELLLSSNKCSRKRPFICEYHSIRTTAPTTNPPSTSTTEKKYPATTIKVLETVIDTNDRKKVESQSATTPETLPSEVDDSRESESVEDGEPHQGIIIPEQRIEAEAAKRNTKAPVSKRWSTAPLPVTFVKSTDEPGDVGSESITEEDSDNSEVVDTAPGEEEIGLSSIDQRDMEDNDTDPTLVAETGGEEDVEEGLESAGSDDSSSETKSTDNIDFTDFPDVHGLFSDNTTDFNDTTEALTATTGASIGDVEEEDEEEDDESEDSRSDERKTSVDWEEELEQYQGCYIPSLGKSLRRLVESAREFYGEGGEAACPQAKIRGLLWPATEMGQMAMVTCQNGKGFATFQCGEDPACWLDQPDTTGCASKKLQSILKKVEIDEDDLDPEGNSTLGTVEPPTVEESIELTSLLVEATAAEEETTVDDVLVTSQVITALTKPTKNKAQIKDKKQVEAIVNNVVEAGSNLVSDEKRDMWREMSEEDKVRSASSLLVAMETATVSMAEEFSEPTVMKKTDENLELELRVLDIEELETEEKPVLTYDSDQSRNTFSIPFKTLKSLSKGKLAKAVFITHYSMSDILGGRDRSSNGKSSSKSDNSQAMSGTQGTRRQDKNKNKQKDSNDDSKDAEIPDTGPKIASYILSASIGLEGHMTKLPEPVTFTMRHVVELDVEKYIPLCSFWNVTNGLSQGFWSQEGCRVLRSNLTHTKCECDHLTNFAILMDVHGVQMASVHKTILQTVTIVGCCISCAALLASLLTFTCFASLQGERNTIHKNLALCLLLAEILFVCGIDQADHQITCAVVAGFLHFLFLAAFSWMFVEGVHIIFMLVQVFDASRSRLPYYYLTGYGVPTIIVGVSLIFYYEGYGTEEYCWLSRDRYFTWAFAGPVALILLVNSIFLSYALTTVCRHAEYVFSSKEKGSGGLRSWIQGALALEVLLGLTWVFGYFLLNEQTTPIAYIFTVLNSLQGLFIFIFHCLLSKKTQKEYSQLVRGIIGYRTLGKGPAGATQSTNTRRTSNSNATTNTFRGRISSNSNSNSHNNHNNQTSTKGEQVDLNHSAEDHQRLFVAGDGPNMDQQSNVV